MSILRSMGLAALIASANLAMAPVAHAEWHQVTTDNFIVYGEGSARSVVREAEELERFDRLMRHTFRLGPDPEGRKLSVYLVRNRTELAQIHQGLDRWVGGFYRASPFGISASLIRGENNHTLFHEYGHHFMLQNFPGHYPGWFVEGFAEYFAPSDVSNPNRVTLGMYAPGRLRQLNQSRWISIERLLSERPFDIPMNERSSYYAQSWLLTHYLLSDPERLKALGGYLDALRRGVDWQTALQSELGRTPEELRADLRAYLNGSMKYGQLQLENTHGEPTVKTLSPAADDFILIRAALLNPMSEERALALLEQLRPLEARYTNDPIALSVLANLEQVWGDNAEAERLLNHLLTLDPNHVDGLRSLAQLRIEEANDLNDIPAETAKLREAQGYLSRAMAVDPTDFRIYRLLAQIRQRAPNYPSQNDLDTLVMALTYAPQVAGLRMQTADAMRRRGMEAEAEMLMSVLKSQAHEAGAPPEPEQVPEEPPTPEKSPAPPSGQ